MLTDIQFPRMTLVRQCDFPKSGLFIQYFKQYFSQISQDLASFSDLLRILIVYCTLVFSFKDYLNNRLHIFTKNMLVLPILAA